MSTKENSNYAEDSLGAIVRKKESDYIYSTTTVSKYVQKSMYEDINTIDAYLNSKHITGDKDSLGRDKPFFNIVTAAANIWYRATALDVGKIKVRSTKTKDTIDSFLATVFLHEWFRKNRFGYFLSDWGRTLSRYGSSVLKFVEKDGELISNVVPWQRLIVDEIDFDGNLKIETMELTEAQLRQRKGYDQDMVEKLCNSHTTRKTQEGQQKDNKSDYIKLYEVHGVLPLSFLTGDEKDEDTYVQQMHVISFVASKEKGKFDDFTLFKGKEEKDPYMITHLIPEDGQTLSIGAVQHLFEAQWMMNHTVKSIKDQLDLASKLIFQTSDGSFVGQNALSAIETGDILIHKINEPLTQLANSSHDIASLQSFGNQWKALSNEIVGISESMLGNTAPSGTAWRQVETLLRQNQSLFEEMRNNKSYYIEDMLRTYVLPFIKKQMDTSEEVSAVLDQFNLDKIDSMYIRNQATRNVNEKLISKLSNNEMVTPEDQNTMMQSEMAGIHSSLKDMGNSRFFKPSDISSKTWKEQFKDLEWEFDIDTKDSDANNDAVTTLTTLLGFFAKKQGQPLSPEEKVVVSKILNLTGQISPIELAALSTVVAPTSTPTPAPAASTPSPIQTSNLSLPNPSSVQT